MVLRAMELATSTLILICTWLAHEAGHAIAARWFGMRVRRFFLFHDASFFSLWECRIRGTVFGIGWLPTGGYVDVDHRGHPILHRCIVLLAGCVVNDLVTIAAIALSIHGALPHGLAYLIAGINAATSAMNSFPIGDADAGRTLQLQPRWRVLLWTVAFIRTAVAIHLLTNTGA